MEAHHRDGDADGKVLWESWIESGSIRESAATTGYPPGRSRREWVERFGASQAGGAGPTLKR
jgi:hypothetical protein